MNRTVIIIGVYHHNALSLVRCFGVKEIDVIYISYGDGTDYISCSRYVKESYHFQTALEAVDKVIDITDCINLKPTVIIADDEIAAIFDARYDEFIGRCFFFNAGKAGRLSHYMDKVVQSKLALDCGFNVPNTLTCPLTDLERNITKFPVIIKPKESINGGKKIKILKGKDDIPDALIYFTGIKNVLVQDYLEKEYEVVILGASVNSNTIVPGFVKKHRDYLGGTTYSTVYSSKELPSELVNSCKKLVSTIGYNGLWGIECIYSKGVFHFIEVNLRNDATTYSLSVAGVNLPYWYYVSVNQVDKEKRIVENNISQVRTIDSMVEFNDFINVAKRKVGFFLWVKQLRKSECKYYYCKKDKKPYYIQFKWFLRTLANKIIR